MSVVYCRFECPLSLPGADGAPSESSAAAAVCVPAGAPGQTSGGCLRTAGQSGVSGRHVRAGREVRGGMEDGPDGALWEGLRPNDIFCCRVVGGVLEGTFFAYFATSCSN